MTIKQAATKLLHLKATQQQYASELLDALNHECNKTTAKDVALRIGCSQQYLSDILRERRSVGFEFVAKVVAAWQ